MARTADAILKFGYQGRVVKIEIEKYDYQAILKLERR